MLRNAKAFLVLLYETLTGNDILLFKLKAIDFRLSAKHEKTWGHQLDIFSKNSWKTLLRTFRLDPSGSEKQPIQ